MNSTSESPATTYLALPYLTCTLCRQPHIGGICISHRFGASTSSGLVYSRYTCPRFLWYSPTTVPIQFFTLLLTALIYPLFPLLSFLYSVTSVSCPCFPSVCPCELSLTRHDSPVRFPIRIPCPPNRSSKPMARPFSTIISQEPLSSSQHHYQPPRPITHHPNSHPYTFPKARPCPPSSTRPSRPTPGCSPETPDSSPSQTN